MYPTEIVFILVLPNQSTFYQVRLEGQMLKSKAGYYYKLGLRNVGVWGKPWSDYYHIKECVHANISFTLPYLFGSFVSLLLLISMLH